MDARIDGRQTRKERIKDVRYQESSVTLDCAQEAAVKGRLFFDLILCETRQCRVFLCVVNSFRGDENHPRGAGVVNFQLEIIANYICRVLLFKKASNCSFVIL